MRPSEDNQFLADHARLLLESYERLTSGELVPAGELAVRAKALYHAPFVVVSHDAAPDPVFNYANLTAQRLFEMDWDRFVRLHSRLSAGPADRAERRRLLEAVTRNGYIDDYAGIRVTASGRRFRVESATVWNVTNDGGEYMGQAATFSDWHYL